MRSAAYTSGRPTHGDPAPAVCLSDPLEAAPNDQICTTTGPAKHDSSAVQNGGDGRVHVLGRWSHSVSIRGRGVLACPAGCAEPIDGGAMFTTGMSLAARNALSGIGALSLGWLCAILATGRPSGTAPGGTGIVPG